MSRRIARPSITSTVLAGVLVACASAAAAQVRAIPPQAKRAEIRHVQEMEVEINGKRVTLAAGVQIRDASNRLILPIALPAGATIRYLQDAQGMPVRVWILTPEEIAARDPR